MRPRTTADALAVLVHDGGASLVNPPIDGGLTSEVFSVLAHSPIREVRRFVANGWATSAETLALLAHFPDERVRETVAEHRSTPPKTLAALAKTAAQGARRAVNLAANPHTPARALFEMAHWSNVDVREAVADNRNAGEMTLALLTGDEYLAVVKRAATNPNTPPNALARTAEVLLKAHGARTTWAPNELFLDGTPSAASIQSLNRFGLQPFMTSPSDVLREIARNTRTPARTLRAIVDCGHLYRESVAENPSAPSELLMRMASEARKWGYDEWDDIVDDTGLVIAIVQNTNTPAATLAQLAWVGNEYTSPDIIQRYVAENPSTPASTLLELSQHAHYPEVRRAAREASAAKFGDGLA